MLNQNKKINKMTLAQLEVWYKGCTEYYQLLKEQLVEEVKSNTVEPAIPVPPIKTNVEVKEYLNVVQSIQLIDKYNWGSRPMYSYLVQFENFNGSYQLNMATETEQKQPVVGSVIKHQLKGTKVHKYKIIKI